MTASRRYILILIIGWALVGAASYGISMSFIGGAAVFFLLMAACSLSVFPLTHLLLLAFMYKKHQRPPSPMQTLLFLGLVLMLLIVVLGSGVFNFV